MNKKGISPLIATVLLIGFVVAIGAVVMFWGKGYVEERTEKEGELSKAQLECTKINLKVIGTDGDITVENRGDVDIDAFKVKYYGGDYDGKLDEVYTKVPPMGRAYIPSRLADQVDVIPAIKPEGVGAPLLPCSDKHKLVNL